MQAQDDGGTANNGVDTGPTPAKTFKINVNYGFSVYPIATRRVSQGIASARHSSISSRGNSAPSIASIHSPSSSCRPVRVPR